MTYTEIKEVNGRKYYYRVKSIRKDDKITKERKYLGVDLDKETLNLAKKEADKELLFLTSLLSDKDISFLEELKRTYAKEPKQNQENRYEAFCSLFTYDSNAIEGNTLTLQETSHLLFDHRVPAAISLREVNEALNHKKAFDYLLAYKGDITRDFILELHRLVVKDTLKPELEDQVGKLRTVAVFIRGVEWRPPKPDEVSKEIQHLLHWYSINKVKSHPLIVAAYFHIVFEAIHPFVDGNGRVGRLLMNFILRKNKYPMINIPSKQKLDYYKALEEAQVRQKFEPFVKMLITLLKESELLF